jgi:hypothetical protein
MSGSVRLTCTLLITDCDNEWECPTDMHFRLSVCSLPTLAIYNTTDQLTRVARTDVIQSVCLHGSLSKNAPLFLHLNLATEHASCTPWVRSFMALTVTQSGAALGPFSTQPHHRKITKFSVVYSGCKCTGSSCEYSEKAVSDNRQGVFADVQRQAKTPHSKVTTALGDGYQRVLRNYPLQM